MKAGWLILLLLITGSSGVWSSEYPTRIVSANLCTDQLLLMLADPEQIVSVSYLSQDAKSSFMVNQAMNYPVNHSRGEELISLEPDLILMGIFTNRSLVELLTQLGYRVEIFKPSDGLADIRSNIRRLAELVGHSQRGERMIDKMDRRINKVRSRQWEKRPRALFYQARGYSSGRQTLQDEALTLAGWRNVSAEMGVVGYGAVSLEQLLSARPEQFFTSSFAPGTDSLAQRQLQHPALKRVTGGRPMIEIDYRYWICGGPMAADVIEQLADLPHE
ncbi:MAG: ABC transporter substrate-binding protein [Gammaproteobacteria bacterium]|nr:ABC transporter substrate-binding protein [Gammaproteobacteria bacterium]